MDLLIHTKHNILITNYLDEIWFWKNIPITFSQGCSMNYVSYTVNTMAADDLTTQVVRVSAAMAWWRHQMETFSALLAICAGNSPVHGEFPAQRSVTRSFDVFFDLCLNKWLSKQSWGWWFETLSCPLWRHCNGIDIILEEYSALSTRMVNNLYGFFMLTISLSVNAMSIHAL